jgi:hypothetical protein
LISFIIDIVSTVLNAIPFIKRFRAPIIISPKQISIGLKPWNIKTTFHVQNRTEEVLFAVWLKLYVENCSLRTNNIKIHSGDRKPFLSAKTSNISINYDFVRIDGVDSIGNDCIFFIIHSLDPQTAQLFTIDITAATNNEYTKKSRILLRVVRHAKTPVKLLSLNNEVAFPFMPPENLTIKSLTLLMKRE